eukprot:c8364_g1_i1.p1 GENE.c8364_g1_i1~~c8364_g1_i1.p1  ORF type:complete len:289 (+),score=55.44 c8364_g1_i1:439-1305(+)
MQSELWNPIKIVAGPVSACVGDFFGLPLDVIKVRMQLANETGSRMGLVRIGTHMVRQEGVFSLFSGLGPAQFRQLTYGGLRMVFWIRTREILGMSSDSSVPAPVYKSVLAGGIAGALSSAICTPADVVKIRLQADANSYRGVAHALTSIVRHEGITHLYRGIVPTSVRAAIVAAAEMGSYDAIKRTFVTNRILSEGQLLYFVCGLTAGFCAIMASFPIDVAKTRLINQGKRGAAVHYTGIVDCLVKTVREKGLLGLYHGSGPAIGRQCVVTVVQWMLYEEICRLTRHA